jgi:PAS domain S-box-containing protein
MTTGNDAGGRGSVTETDALQAALAAAGTGTWHWSVATGLVHWDATLEALCGMAPGEFGATYEAWLESLHPDERDGILGLVQDALERRGPYQFEHRTVWPDGTIHWLECRGEVVTDADGNPAGTVGCAVDITARKVGELELTALLEQEQEAATRLTRLQQVSVRLTAALTSNDVIAAVVESLDAPRGATGRGLWLVDPSGEELVLAGHAGMKPEAADMFERIDLRGGLPAALAVRDRRTIISPSGADGAERFPDLHGVPRTGPCFIAVPLAVENEALGVLAFGYDGPLEEPEVAFLEAAAGNIAQTLQRVRLAEALERRSEEIAFLAEITRAAISATDHRDLMKRIANAAVPRLGDVCTIHFVAEPGAKVETVAAHADPKRTRQASGMARQFPHGPAGENVVDRVLRTGRPEFITNLEPGLVPVPSAPDGGHDAQLADAIADLGLSSSITVPMRSAGHVIGALQVLAGRSRPPHSDRDVALAGALALGIGEALASRWLTDQHRHISASLQRAFLPPILETIPGVDVATAYWPAGEASEVGGDFYDLFAIDERCWALLIGDACGTGPDAAATAAIARHTARAAARHGLDHHEVLDWMNQAVKHSHRNLFCTACYATIRTEPHDNTIAIDVAAAGHPLPIVVGEGRAASLGEPGTLLGVFDDPTFVVRHHSLLAGEAIVFYTDGITDLPAPYGRTAEQLEELLSLHPARSAAALLATMRHDLDTRAKAHGHADDVAVLIIRNDRHDD